MCIQVVQHHFCYNLPVKFPFSKALKLGAGGCLWTVTSNGGSDSFMSGFNFLNCSCDWYVSEFYEVNIFLISSLKKRWNLKPKDVNFQLLQLFVAVCYLKTPLFGSVLWKFFNLHFWICQLCGLFFLYKTFRTKFSYCFCIWSENIIMSALFQRCPVFIHILERKLDQKDQSLKSHKQDKEKLLSVLWGIISFSSKIYSKWTLIRLVCFFQPLPSALFYPLLLLAYNLLQKVSQNPKSDAEVGGFLFGWFLRTACWSYLRGMKSLVLFLSQ